MSLHQNVVSLADVRRQKDAVTTVRPCSATELSTKIDLIVPQYVSLGAWALLRVIHTYQEAGEQSLPCRFLCEALRTTNKTIAKWTDELEDAALLRVRRSRINKKENAVNHYEIDFSGPLGGAMPELKMPKKMLQGGTGKIPTPPSRGIGKIPTLLDIYKENKIPKGINAQARASRSFDSVEDALTKTKERVATKRAAKAAVAKRSPVLMLAGVRATWAEAMLRHYPSVPAVAMTAKDFAIAKAKLQPLLAVATLDEIFNFFVENWSTLRSTKFAWLRAKGKDVAPAPTLPELMLYWKVFAQAFADSRMVAATQTKRVSVTAETKLEVELAEAKARAAAAEAEKRKLAERLADTERIAYGQRRRRIVKDTRTLTERRAQLDASYNSENDNDIPEWRDEP